MQIMLVLGSIMMFLAVAIGAFGAHALKPRLNADMLKIYETGVQYHLVHGIGIIAAGIASSQLTHGHTLATAAGWCLVGGIVLFSGSLYALSLSGIRKLGAITPLGGLLFLAGWVLLAIAVMQR
ncbi:DUF423 domain-containing protein [Paenibacillus campi]|uniref:DUF423 domain-containing protein n=1 Tax=Paenibacillus campi TaxID=3106031 RepID=UPI002AFFEB7B|nr:DUF423 domain-containing protein [Paenibacillus sp. SGZ-1014]